MQLKDLATEKNIHLFFRISLYAKGAFAVIELLGGMLTFFVTEALLVGFIRWVMQNELLEDPKDAVANYLLQAAHSFSVSAQYFTAVYFLAHGIVKLWLIVGLLRDRLWYYPVAIGVFGLFIVYQIYRYLYVSQSILLVLLTILDLVVIVLTWHEYRFLRGRLSAETV